MEQLPLDLKIDLLLCVDEFSSLWNLINTCHSMNDAFRTSRKLILASVLRRAMDPRVLCDALALHHAASLNTREFYTLKAFLRRWSIPCAPPPPDTVVFNSLARRQSLIEWFLRDLCAELVKRNVYKRPPGATPHDLRPLEIIRIHRAFYHFDLFAILFAENVYPNVDYDDSFDMEEIREIYISRMPPWEVEELTCIHAYLHERCWEYIYPQPISNSPNQKTSSKVEFARACLQSFFGTYNRREHFLSLGLQFLHSIFTASEEKMFEIANTHAGFDDNKRFLGSTLQTVYSALSLVEERPDFSDRMTLKTREGPSDGWLWANDKNCLSRKCRLHMIGWGYCLWDRQRMEKLVELDQPFDETRYAKKSPRRREIACGGRREPVKSPNPS